MLRLSDFVKISLLDHEKFIPEDIFQILSNMKTFLEEVIVDALQKNNNFNNKHYNSSIEGLVYIDKTAVIEPYVFIKGPCYVGPGAEIRHGAYIRGNTYIGREAVVGHSTEIKNSILFNKAKAGHFNYIGDSILGIDTNLGAGTKIANLRLDNQNIKLINKNNEKIDTKLRKFGAILGDLSQTGCNSVLSPGSLLYPGSIIMPNEHFKGTKC